MNSTAVVPSAIMLACCKRASPTSATPIDTASPSDAAIAIAEPRLDGGDANDDGVTGAAVTFTYDRWKAGFDPAVHCQDVQQIIADMPIFHDSALVPRPAAWLLVLHDRRTNDEASFFE